jgi:Flp pilus assembly protein TadG
MMRYQLDRRGQEIVEYALVLPLLLLLIFAVLDFGLTVFAYSSVANAAREGARAGVVPSATEADMVAAAIERTGGVKLTPANFTVTQTVTQTQVEVAYDHPLISGPIIQIAGGSPVLQLRSVATMRNE